MATAMSLGWVAMQASLHAHDRKLAAEPADGRSSRCRAGVCCRAGWCRRNRGSACAAAGCPRSSPCCAAGPRRRRAVRATAGHSRAARARRRRDRCCAPARRCASPPSGVGSILSSARPFTSIRCAGVSICSFIRSSRLVPPAMNLAPGSARGGGRGLGGRAGALVGEGLHASLPATSVIASTMLE